MSLEAALEEERLEILKLLERPAGKSSHQHPTGAQSTPSSPRIHFAPLLPPLNSRTSSPSRAPIHSLIAAAQDPPPDRSSIDTAVASSPRSSTGNLAWPNSNGTPHRNSMSSLNGAPKLLRDRDKHGNLTPNDAYNFAVLPSASPPAPKRATQTSWNDPAPPSSHHGSLGPPGRRSLSPISNAALHHMQRSTSPRASSGRLASPPPVARNQISNQITNDAGVPLDLEHAYAKLSDDALARSGGVLRTLPERRPITTFEGEHVRAGTGESLTSEGGVRLQKDYGVDVDERAVIDSSDEDETSSAEESVGSNSPVSEGEERRGRAAARRNGSRSSSKSSTAGTEGGVEKGPGMIKSMIRIVGDSGGGGSKKKKKGGGIDARKGTISMRRTSMSLLAAAEEERKAVSARYSVRSLLPSISITPSGGVPGATSPTTSRRPGVHPSTNFDLPSHNSTPMSSDTEADVRDLHRAQRMEMSFSPITSTPETQRVVRTILRGEYESIVKEAEEGNKRVRKYLVATDLSGEAQHALEWTIGTVLRDGDTLMAIYAIDQDTVEDGGKIVPDDRIAGELSSQAAAVGTSLAAVNMPHTPGTASPLSNFGDISERSRERTKAEQERYVAAEAITRLVEKLLKKTRLQVKVTVEVIHCKSPKHLLTEIIDFMEPTLVVLGSRGRSALKGVLLGSFSNYLVTKSSVPVMVARKKLKHTKKFAKTNVRQPNNLTTSAQAGRLAGAKVD